MDRSVGVNPLLGLFVTLHWMPLFERWQKVPVVEAVVEEAPGLAAFGEEPACFRGCAAGGER